MSNTHNLYQSTQNLEEHKSETDNDRAPFYHTRQGSQPYPQNHPQLSQMDSAKSIQLEKLNLQNWSAEVLNRIMYGLLQQIELVKYILSNEELAVNAKWRDAGKRVLDTIIKYCSPHAMVGSGSTNNLRKSQN